MRLEIFARRQNRAGQWAGRARKRRIRVATLTLACWLMSLNKLPSYRSAALSKVESTTIIVYETVQT